MVSAATIVGGALAVTGSNLKGTQMRRAAPASGTALRMVSGRYNRSRSLYRRKNAITDNAPRGSFPTSLLNHETSDHLLSRLKARPPFHREPRPRVPRALHNI
jgi:hypothetical protein